MLNISETSIFIPQKSQDSKLKAYATIVFESCFIIRRIKIIEGQKGLFLSMPSLQKKDGSFQNIVHPITKEARIHIEKTVLKAYEEELKKNSQKKV